MFESWEDFIKHEKEQEYFKSLILKVKEDAKNYKIFPRHDHVFNAFKLCSLPDVKVVILGMDPYHGENQAHGLAFSVQEHIPIPPSLKNIFKEINSDLGVQYKFANGVAPYTLTATLTKWAEQGVLLLNSFLTVREGQPGSHKNFGWAKFTDKAISILNSKDSPIVFILWGAHARAKKELINNNIHLILESAHPSPLSAYNGFFGNKHFSKTNSFLMENNINIINWLI